MGCVIGIDVGTGSARAGVFDLSGAMLGSGKCPIALHKGAGGVVEQSSEDIWNAVCTSVKAAVAQAGVDPASVKGIGFDATCSLVILGQDGAPLPVAEDRNIIVWMDHRALDQAERINAMGHNVLSYVGGRISPEMETPKLLWLKENMPDVYAKAWQFMDLTDFLTWRASGDLARSICTVTCKWTYLGHEGRWDDSYFRAIGLGDLADQGFERIGTNVVEAGTPLGAGLTDAAAAEMGLPVGTPVGAGLIDAHAGGIGSVGDDPQARLAYVFGTSSCTMTSTSEPAFVSGVWGPYFSAMVPGLWLNEGGQSAAGAAIDELILHHPFAPKAQELADKAGLSLPDWLAEQAEGCDVLATVKGLHVVPEPIGNRAPHADPNTRAVISGIGMARDQQSLVSLYLASLCGLGYGLRQIIEAQARTGTHVQEVVISGGAGRSALVRQVLADTTGLPVAAPDTAEPVLLGAAILGAVAGQAHGSVTDGMSAMSSLGARFHPDPTAVARHNARFAVYEDLQAVARGAVAV